MLDVYRDFYGLTGEPFRLSPDHRFSLGHRSYANAKAYLDYALLQGEGFIAITGGPGTGKTTLISDILAGFEQTNMRVATLTSTQLESRDLLHMVAHAFDLHPEDRSKANLLLELERFLNQQSYQGHRTILIVDEAQSLSASALEELRLLANMQRNHSLLLQIFLVGQEKLLDLIRAPGMEQLQQRLVAASVLEPLDLHETVDYVEHRLSRVAWRGDPAIHEDALRLIHKHSGGIPRRINMICNRLFLYGGMEEKHELAGDDARAVIEEMHQEFLLPARLIEDEKDETCGDATTATSSGDAPVLSLPRGDKIAHSPARPPGSISAGNEGLETPVADAKARPMPRRARAERSHDRKLRRDSLSPMHAEAASDRVPRRNLDRQAVDRASRAVARSAAAGETATRQRSGRHRWMVAAGIFLLLGVVLSAIVGLDSDVKELLKGTGLIASNDAFKSSLQTTGVHKAVKVLPDDEETVTPGTPGKAPVLTASKQADVVDTQSQQKPANAVVTPNLDVNVASADAEVSAPTEPSDSEAINSVSAQSESEPEKEKMVDSQERDSEDPNGGVEIAQVTPPSANNSVSQDDETQSQGKDVANGAAIEAEYGKLRRIAGERFSERQMEVEAGAPKVAPPANEPLAAAVVASATVSKNARSTAHSSAPQVPVSKPKVSSSSRTAANAPAAMVSEPKLSTPKVTAPKVSQPKITVARAATPTPTPARATTSASQSLKQLRSTLLEGQWTSRGKAASLLPSEITFCSSQGDERIGCWSVPQDITTKYGPALYKVETAMNGFSRGSFRLSYRTLVKLLDADMTELAKQKAASSPDGWQVSEHSMQCQLTKPDTVLCRDQKGVTRNYSRSESRKSN